jgi:hypothetical protein
MIDAELARYKAKYGDDIPVSCHPDKTPGLSAGSRLLCVDAAHPQSRSGHPARSRLEKR